MRTFPKGTEEELTREHQRHGHGGQEKLGQTLLLLQAPGQVAAASAAQPLPQPQQDGRQQG